MHHQITDAEAYKRGFERGYTLCLSMKKLSREFSAVLKSVVSKDFQHSYGIGLQEGYNEGFRNVKKELAQQKLEEHQMRQQNQQEVIHQKSQAHNKRLQQRQAEMQHQQQQQDKEEERDR